jgi:phenylacetate-CoA ligase
MAIRFRALDFLQPLALSRFLALMARAQWWSEDRLRHHQATRLRHVLVHAAAQVPYYRDLFARVGFDPATVRGIGDLSCLPTLSRDIVRSHPGDLLARNAARFRPQRVSSTGSTGAPVDVWIDRQTNALEFAFYWRHWSWFGYRLGDAFAQLSWAEFDGAPDHEIARAQRGTGRLLLNARSVSRQRAARFAEAMRAHGTRFLKGHPSALLHFALFVRGDRLEVPRLRAVFTTGEVLEPGARRVIGEVFGAPVADAYGTMERVVAACECPRGRMHVNADYGAWEAVDPQVDVLTGRRIARIVGTGLHNLSMPLVRYEMGDFVELDDETAPCPCGRTLPTIGRLRGRSVDAIITPEGRVITVASIVFNAAPSVAQGQLVQDEIGRLRVRVLPTEAYDDEEEARLLHEVRRLVGQSMRIEIERVDAEAFGPRGVKHRTVVSTVSQQSVAAGQALP